MDQIEVAYPLTADPYQLTSPRPNAIIPQHFGPAAQESAGM